MPVLADKTPDVLYVMADEKYIPLQGEQANDESDEDIVAVYVSRH